MNKSPNIPTMQYSQRPIFKSTTTSRKNMCTLYKSALVLSFLPFRDIWKAHTERQTDRQDSLRGTFAHTWQNSNLTLQVLKNKLALWAWAALRGLPIFTMTTHPSITLHGPSIMLHGPAVSLHGLAIILHGPAITLQGSSITLHGPAITLHGSAIMLLPR